MLVEFGHNPPFIGKVVKSGSALTNPGKNRKRSIKTVISDKVNNTLKISLCCFRPDNRKQMPRHYSACLLRSASLASMREKTSSCPLNLPARMSFSPCTISLSIAIAFRMLS